MTLIVGTTENRSKTKLKKKRIERKKTADAT
jgi:hypothetical protein